MYTENNTISRYAPTGSVARAMAKGLPARLSNLGTANLKEVNIKHSPPTTFAGRYKAIIKTLRIIFRGATIHTEETGKGKNRVFTLVGFDTDTEDGHLHIVECRVKLRDTQFGYSDAPITITRHAWERISQRHAGLSASEMLLPVKTFYLNYKTIPRDPGKYEVGVGCGIFIAARDSYRGDLALVTFISKDKCTRGQDCSIGAVRNK